MKLSPIIFSLSVIIFACKVQPSSAPKTSLENIIKEKVGAFYTREENSSGKFALYIQLPNDRYPNRLVKAFVLDLKFEEIVLEKSFVPGYIKWIDETKLELLDLPGIIKDSQNLEDFIKTIEIKPTHKR